MRYSVANLVAIGLSVGLSSPIPNTTIYPRDDQPYRQLETIFGNTPSKFLNSALPPYMITWDKITSGSTKDKAQSKSGNVQGTLVVVTGTEASWAFGMTPRQRNAINKLRSGANAKAVQQGDAFKSLFTYAILGEKTDNVPKDVEMADVPLSKFQDHLKRSDGVPVSILFISPSEPVKTQPRDAPASRPKMQNEALIYAMAWEISSKLGDDLPVAWMPSTLDDKDPRAYWYGWRRSYKENIDVDGYASAPGHLVEAWYGLHKVIDAAFPVNPLTINHYRFTSAADLNLFEIPAGDAEPANVNVADEFERLWGINPVVNGDRTVQSVVTSSDDPPLCYDIRQEQAIVITVVMSDFSYTLIVPTSTRGVRAQSQPEANPNDHYDIARIKQMAQESIKSALAENSAFSEFCEATQLLDVFVVFISVRNTMAFEYFTRAAVRMVIESILAEKVGTERWSRKIHLIASHTKHKSGSHRIVVSNSKQKKLSIGEPGVSFRFFCDTGFRALWELGDSGEVTHQYTDPAGLVQEMDWP